MNPWRRPNELLGNDFGRCGMIAEETRDVMAEEVAVRGDHYIGTRPGAFRFFGGPDTYHLGGGYVVGVRKFTTGTAQIELAKVGRDEVVEVFGFNTHAEAVEEFGRVKAQLQDRERVQAVVDLLYVVTGILPAEFLGAVRGGDLTTLLVAADFRDEQGEADKAVLLRSAYYRLTGRANVEVKVDRKTTLVLNTMEVTKRTRPESKSTTLGELTAAVVTVGEGVRTVGLKTNSVHGPSVVVREYRVGDQAEYDSYNLVYFAPIAKVTAKTVEIVAYGKEKHRLTLAKFVDKNFDFDLAAARKRNDAWMD
jgi:hypothetical protein